MNKYLKLGIVVMIVGGGSTALIDDLGSQKKAVTDAVLEVQSKKEAVKKGSDATVLEIIRLTNAERQKVGIAKLTSNSALQSVAQRKAELYAREDYFAHPEPDGTLYTTRLLESGYVYSYAGENIVVTSLDTATSEKIISMWIESHGHYQNLIRATYSEIGVGIAIGMRQGVPAVWAVQEFGSR